MNQNTQRTFAIGDIHGGYRALVKALDLAKFDYDNDKLIALGDVCDGWSETPEAIEELLKIKNLVYIKGNHDVWAYKGLTNASGFMGFSGEGRSWLHHGGQATSDAYDRRADLKEKHLEFLKNAKPFYLDEKNRLFVHAGIRPGIPVSDTPEDVLVWDRNFWYSMYAGKNVGKEYLEVYIGHTPRTDMYKEFLEIDNYGNLIANEDCETKIKGVYAAGDVRAKKFRQLTTATSDGTIAALMAEEYIKNLN